MVKMIAATFSKYGGPEVLEIKELPAPVPKEHEILVRVHATTVNRTDCGFLLGTPYVVRFFNGFFKPKVTILGNEYAGEVVEAGKQVTTFRPGDRVFGFIDWKFSAHAGYVAVAAEGPVSTIPGNMTYEEAAPILEGSHYALSDIRAAKVQAGQHVMIYGATGAIGSAAVQLVKHLGAKVTAVCNTKNVSLVKSLGADHVIDYQTQDFTKTTDRFDFIFDAVGKQTFGACKPLLKNKGIYISTDLGPGAQNPFLALTTPWGGGRKLLFPLPKINREIAEYIKALVVEGIFKPVIDRTYPLREIREAFTYVLSQQKTGNVVIRMEQGS